MQEIRIRGPKTMGAAQRSLFYEVSGRIRSSRGSSTFAHVHRMGRARAIAFCTTALSAAIMAAVRKVLFMRKFLLIFAALLAASTLSCTNTRLAAQPRSSDHAALAQRSAGCATGPRARRRHDDGQRQSPRRKISHPYRQCFQSHAHGLRAQGNNTGAAVVVFPGGGYRILAIDLEGTEVCDWLNSAGITCILVKYRVPEPGPYPKVFGPASGCAARPRHRTRPRRRVAHRSKPHRSPGLLRRGTPCRGPQHPLRPETVRSDRRVLTS